jgi:DtxR family Mn-dependent transcriptional regulator
MPSDTVEDYVKAIYTLQRESPTGEATVVRLAATLGVTKGTVTAMVHTLRRAKLAVAPRYAGIRLTPRGTRLALDVIRRHRLIEVFLVDVLKYDWSEVHDEAERLEHALSPTLLDRLDAYLGRPAIDPHGDPIPDASGRMASVREMPLRALGAGASAVVSRVTDQDAAFLAFAARHGLRPGTRVTLLDVQPAAQSVLVRAGGGKGRGGRGGVAMSFAVADKVRVRPDAPESAAHRGTLKV